MSRFSWGFVVVEIVLIEASAKRIAGAALACNQPTRHYISMGCTPSEQRTAERCPVSYDCPNVVGRRSDKCYLFGKSYAIGEKVPDDETSPICTALVNCIEYV